jgi:hypothetical protein
LHFPTGHMKFFFNRILCLSISALALFSGVQPKVHLGSKKKFTVDLATVCLPGTHPDGSKCVSNLNHCEQGYYHALDNNCSKCKWFSNWVRNDTIGSKTGDYCEDRIWLWILGGVASLLAFILVCVLCVYAFCVEPKKRVKYQPLREDEHRDDYSPMSPKRRDIDVHAYGSNPFMEHTPSPPRAYQSGNFTYIGRKPEGPAIGLGLSQERYRIELGNNSSPRRANRH